MAGESGGELGASMLGVGMLDAAPGIFALEVGASNAATEGVLAILEFIVSSESFGAGMTGLEALLSFNAQADVGGESAAISDALLEFNASLADAGAASSLSLDAWLQMLHARGDIADLSMQVGYEDRALRIRDAERTISVPADRWADEIVNQNEPVKI